MFYFSGEFIVFASIISLAVCYQLLRIFIYLPIQAVYFNKVKGLKKYRYYRIPSMGQISYFTGWFKDDEEAIKELSWYDFINQVYPDCKKVK